MIEYSSREDAENDPNLNLKIIWKCSKCGNEREDYPRWNVGGICPCGGEWIEIGESYNSL